MGDTGNAEYRQQISILASPSLVQSLAEIRKG